jgi:hypothetical protein
MIYITSLDEHSYHLKLVPLTPLGIRKTLLPHLRLNLLSVSGIPFHQTTLK